MSNYTSSLNPRVRAFVEWRLEHYQDDKRMLLEYLAEKMPSNVAAYGAEATARGQSGTGRPTEGLAVKLAADRYIVELERTVNAIEHVTERLTPERKKLVELVYWRGTHTPSGAAAVLHISRRTAYRYINEILTAIAAEMGFCTV
jgi:RinA family phage transcriptional activator